MYSGDLLERSGHPSWNSGSPKFLFGRPTLRSGTLTKMLGSPKGSLKFSLEHSLDISFTSGSFASCNLFIIQISYRDAWIVFSKKFATQNRKIENNDKEEVRFQTLQKAPTRRAIIEERKNFPPRIEKGVHVAAVR